MLLDREIIVALYFCISALLTKLVYMLLDKEIIVGLYFFISALQKLSFNAINYAKKNIRRKNVGCTYKKVKCKKITLFR